jgi:hypothetical protein
MWISEPEYQEIERSSGSWGLSHSEMKYYQYTFDTLITYNDRLVQKILGIPNEIGIKKEKSTMEYYIDLENYAFVKISESAKGRLENYGDTYHSIEYQYYDDRWYLKSYFRSAKPKPGLGKSFNVKLLVTNIRKGENKEIVPLGYKYVERVELRLGQWNDSFWDNYNYIVLDDIWKE